MTLHKLLYQAAPTPEGGYIYSKKNELDYHIIVVDEISMLSQDMIDDLLFHDVFVIFCGDPKQLPSLDKDNPNHLLDTPDIFLDEIMRQALDSGIIQLSMKIRNNEDISGFNSNDAKVLRKNQLSTGMLEWADQILCATNATRKMINSQCRALKGYTEPIVDGEKIICLRNEWDTLSASGSPLTNGVIGTLNNLSEYDVYFPQYLGIPNNKIKVIEGRFISDTGEDYGRLVLDKNCILTGEPSLTPQQKYKINRNKKLKKKLPYEFTYSYCLSCHKSQGSSFNKVLIIEENFPFDKEEHLRWAYTACTRGIDKVVYVMKG